MTSVSRPVHLQLQRLEPATKATATSKQNQSLSQTSISLPSQILPHLFVGDQEQTNKETLNRLNISYILSLGLLPLISDNVVQQPNSPTTATPPTTTPANSSNNATTTITITSLPSQNSSKDFKIRVKSGNNNSNSNLSPIDSDERKGVKLVRFINCKCINIADNSEQILTKFFDEAHQFIDEARRKKCNVLVHCLAGISRSPTIAIAYLMRVNSLRLKDAYNLVKQCRPQIDPNLSFVGQLMVYEKSLEDNASSSATSTKN